MAQQHYQTFADRFADWPVRIESLSRFRSGREVTQVLQGLENGQTDIVIGTHRLLQSTVKFARLGLIVIDEEHRFGVKDKERLKELRAQVDVLTLTATPIPRTLNMAMGGLRELSLITTPPAARLSIKTFVSQWDMATVREACLREIRRGGQIYFVHNSVDTIERREGPNRTRHPKRASPSVTDRCASANSNRSCSTSIISAPICSSARRSSKAASTCRRRTPSSSIVRTSSASRNYISCVAESDARIIRPMRTCSHRRATR